MNFLNKTSLQLEQVMPLVREVLERGNKVFFDPKGVSMRPMLRQGIDRIELGPVRGPLKKYDLPLYIRDNGQYVLHRVVAVGETYTCIGDNQFWYEKGIRPQQLIGVASGFYRGEKYFSVDAFFYKLYCRLWCGTRPLRRQYHRGKSLLRRIFVKNK